MRALCWHGKGDVRVDTVPEDAPEMYKKFRDKKDGVIKVVLRPG